MPTAFISGPLAAPTVWRRLVNVLRALRWAEVYHWSGYTVICPAREAGWRFVVYGETEAEREAAIQRCLVRVAELGEGDVFVVLPGWERSEGCISEYRALLRTPAAIVEVGR